MSVQKPPRKQKQKQTTTASDDEFGNKEVVTETVEVTAPEVTEPKPEITVPKDPVTPPVVDTESELGSKYHSVLRIVNTYIDSTGKHNGCLPEYAAARENIFLYTTLSAFDKIATPQEKKALKAVTKKYNQNPTDALHPIMLGRYQKATVAMLLEEDIPEYERLFSAYLSQ